MSAGESAVLRSVKPHVGKENAMLPPLTSPSRVLSLSRGQKYVGPKTGQVRRPTADEEPKIHRATSPIPSEQNVPNQQRRIQQLEKSILFMREHHDKIVSALHEEIDELKRKNKELNFRLVMSPASLPAHLLSPEEDQPPSSSPRHQARATAAVDIAPAHPVQLELMEGELTELRQALRQERERSDQLASDLRQVEVERSVPGTAAGRPDGEVAALEQQLSAAETAIRQLKRERDECQRELHRMRSSVQFRPPCPPPAGLVKHRPETRGSTAPARPADSRGSSSQGSLPALPRARARQPPPPPPRAPKQ
ncbi:formin-like protein 13 [Pollicipes pollicipes]|uniref:formin-like protein 13 n=1 Tax=Pollicipes pollicipes TaxID=41117 RepID=UPI001884F411|nr:formin-like protein 13 [Pollicipes pollicipes]